MAAQLGLPDALRRRGLVVEVVPGWETRSAGSFAPKGALCHWTAGPANSTTRPSLNICVNGREGLPGPLCNVYLARDGVAVVVAAGRANHAGVGSWRGLTGNSAVFGTEAEAAGPNDFTAAQRAAYPKVNAAYCDLGGFGPEMVCGHSEWAGARKTDINGYTMDQMRAQVAALLAGQTLAPEDDMFSDQDRKDLQDVKVALQWWLIPDDDPSTPQNESQPNSKGELGKRIRGTDASVPVLLATIAAQNKLIAAQNGMTVEDVDRVVRAAIADGVAVDVTVNNRASS